MLKITKLLFKMGLLYLYDAILYLLPHMYIPPIVNESKNKCESEVVKPLKTPNTRSHFMK